MEEDIKKKNFIKAIDNITERYNRTNVRYYNYSEDGTFGEYTKVKVYEDELIAINSYIVQVLGR